MQGRAAVETFVSDPGAWADPELAAPLFSPGLRAETIRRLLASPRLAARASRYLADHLGCGNPDELAPVDLWLAGACPTTQQDVARRAGAVWHARRVCALVLSADIASLCDRFGQSVRSAALRHAELTPDADHSSPADDAATLAEDIEQDGTRCMAAWIDALPDWAAARMRLKWHGEPVPPAWTRQREAAVRIIRAVAQQALAA
jgi:hypothetical protein